MAEREPGKLLTARDRTSESRHRRLGLGLLSLLLGVLVVWPAPALANDAAFYGEGATIFAIKEERIVMASESITIRYDAQASDPARRWVASCVFVFRNTSKQPVEVQMGFPDWLAHGEAPARGPDGKADPGAWAIRDFAVRVGGKDIPVAHKEIADPGDRPALPRRVKIDYDAAYTWTMQFAPGETIEVENTYRFGGLSSNGPLSGCVWDKRPSLLRSLFWRNAPVKKGGWDFENCLCRRVTYVVTTGRTWGGPIGKAEIAIQIPPDVWPHLVVPLPAAASVADGWVRWRFENWTPRDELTLVFVRPIMPETESDKGSAETWLPLFDTPRQANAWVRFARQNGVARDMVARVRQGYERRLGMAAHPALDALADEGEWGPRPAPRAAPSAAERAIMQILKRFEKRARPR